MPLDRFKFKPMEWHSNVTMERRSLLIVIHVIISIGLAGLVASTQNGTSNANSTTPANATRQLIDKDGHETRSTSMMSDIYNLLHSQSGEQPIELKFTGEEERGKPQKSSRQPKQNQQQQQQHQAQITDGRPEYYPENQAIALGSEIAAFNGLLPQQQQHLLQQQATDPQTIDASGLMVEPSQVYDQSAALTRQIPVPNDNVVARLYIDAMGNQYLQRPDSYEALAHNGARQRQYAASDQYSTQPMSLYGRPPSQSHAVMGPPPAASGLDEQQLHQFYGDPTRVAMLRHQQLQQQHQQQQQQPKEQQSAPEASSPQKSKLSNDQLMTLIDELKDFNSKQASKILSRGTSPPTEEESSDGDDDNEEHIAPPDPVEKPALASAKTVEVKSKEGPQMDAEDLSKFAKFLLSKEGSNMRFQLGLDKDSPDDGDEEDTDTLLESKAKQMKTKKYPKELTELDRKQSQVSSNIDQLIDSLSRSTDTVKRHRKRKKAKIQPADEERDENDPLLKARRRRHQQSEQTKKFNREKPKITSREDDDSKVNFAKMLIHQEMMQDKQDTDKLSTSPANPKPTTGVASNNHSRRNRNPPTGSRKSRRSNEGPVETTEISGGDENYKYQRPERNRDHIALIHELQKSRKTQSNMRSRIPIKMEPLAQRALDGEMGLRTQTEPDGNVLVRSNRDSLLTLKVPRDATSSSSSSSSDDQETSKPAGGYDDEDGSLRDSSPEGDNSQLIDSVSLKSPKPVKDEYPVSERVGERLNKLSKNLDRYFNDGFLQEVEIKAKLRDDTDASKPLAESSNESSEKVPGNKPENGEDDKKSSQVSGVKVDKDFDVDVGIDGKRDPDSKDSDEDEDADDEAEDKVGEKSDDSGEKDVRKSKGSGGSQVTSRSRGKNKSRGTVKTRRRNNNENLDGNPVEAVSLQENEPQEGESRGGSMKTALSAGKENMEFEGQAKMLPNLDPVDIETLETPIGPDGAHEPDVDKASRKKVQSSNTEDKVSAKYGKKVDGKFYDEPEWKR